VSGLGGVSKSGGYSLILSNANTYTGGTVVNGGKLALVGNGSIAGSSNIVIAAGATLDASARSDAKLTLAPGQRLSGNGSITGGLTVSAGATLAPGGAPGNLTVSGAVTLQGATVMELNKTANTNDTITAGSFSYGGTLVLTNLSGTLAASDSFKLFNGAGTGTFSNIVPAIPGLNLAWDTNSLATGVISVVALSTPPPVFGAATITADGLVFSGSNGVPGWPYYLLGSSNASLPLSNWTILMSNWFDGNGNFQFTNGAGANGPQQFFILQLP
jgi:autotransporter-associated beta strand protein